MHQVWRMDLATARLEPFSGSGREDLVDAVHSEAALGQPSGLSGDAQQLYVADSEVNAVRAASLHPFGRIVTLAGGGLFAFGDRDGLGGEARLQHPLGVVYAGGTVYVADTYNHKIKALDPRTGRLQTLAGTGMPGNGDGPGDQAQFYEPGGLSVGGGQLYVADTNNQCIRVLDLTSRLVSTLTIRGLTPPTAATMSTPAAAPDAVVKLAEQALPAASQGVLRIALELPSGFKLSPGAPATLAVSVQGDGVRVLPEHGVQTVMPLHPHLAVPLYIGPPEARALLQVDLAFVICRRDDQGLCALRQIVWQAPVRSQSGSAASALTLHYRVRPF
jgi:DNA-binding beta-propeller fold protein YncE